MINSMTLTFLRQLKKNNNKAWFDAHRKDYEAAKLNFEQFIQQVIDQHSKKDPSLSGMAAKSCMFRINRDVRFSKDKSPYKTNFGAFLNFNKRADFGFIANFAAIEINKGIDFDIFAQLDIWCNACKFGGYHEIT